MANNVQLRIEKLELNIAQKEQEKAILTRVIELMAKYRDRESDLSLDPDYDARVKKLAKMLKERRLALKKAY